MRIRAVVDVIEAGKVLMLLGPEETPLFWPKEALPPDIRESHIVYIDVNIDFEETKRIREENQRQLDEMIRRSQQMEK